VLLTRCPLPTGTGRHEYLVERVIGSVLTYADPLEFPWEPSRYVREGWKIEYHDHD
jgi:hypothetical protein